MGLVYRAYDTQLHRPVAVKLLSPRLTSDPEKKQRLLQEARAAGRISHPAIAQIFYADEEGDVTFVVMELVEGKTVRDLIQERELDLLGAIDIAIRIADGLAKAHERGIVHRDIKPANVMLTADGHVKILILAWPNCSIPTRPRIPRNQSSERSQPPRPSLGWSWEPGLPKTEQVRGVPVDLRADIFSVGVLLFEMVTGQSPFRRDNLMDSFTPSPLTRRLMNSVRAQIPEELQRIVSRCQKTPEDRYPDARLWPRNCACSGGIPRGTARRFRGGSEAWKCGSNSATAAGPLQAGSRSD